MSHPLKEEAVQWQTGFMATPRCFTYRYTLKITVFHSIMSYTYEVKMRVSWHYFFQRWEYLGDSNSTHGHPA